jgi:DNA-binding NarL/FixJ family response regulator
MKILLADDHTLFREGLRHVLQGMEGGVEILQAATCAEAMDIAALHPDLDVALLDLNMPGMDGFEAVRTFRERFPILPLVVLSASDARHVVQKVLDEGALGFIPKSSSAQVMISALRLVLSGGVYLPPLLLEQSDVRMVERSAASIPPVMYGSAPDVLPVLTERQLEALTLLAEGKPNKLIARALNVTEGTVKIHLAAVFRALKVSNRTEAVIEARKFGLLRSAGASEQ